MKADRPRVIIYNAQRKIKAGESLRGLIAACVEQALLSEGLFLPCEVGVTLVSDEKIRKLNKEHREIDQQTDVLSFPLYEPDEIKKIKKSGPDGEVLLGDIVISLETALRQSEEYGHSLEREAGYLSVHSALHLLGYDHETEADKRKMREKEESIMRSCHLERKI